MLGPSQALELHGGQRNKVFMGLSAAHSTRTKGGAMVSTKGHGGHGVDNKETGGEGSLEPSRKE